MGIIKSYKDLLIWQRSMVLVKDIYQITNRFPEKERFGLISQMNRAAVSIPSNIAEGWGRESRKDYVRFLRISRGSLFELETQILIAKQLDYIEESKELEKEIIEISKMMNAVIRKLSTTTR